MDFQKDEDVLNFCQDYVDFIIRTSYSNSLT